MKELFKDTRAVLAVYWSIVATLLLCYITIRFGERVEILTLIIGMIGGTILGGIFGVYFSGTNAKKNTDAVLPTDLTENK